MKNALDKYGNKHHIKVPANKEIHKYLVERFLEKLVLGRHQALILAEIVLIVLVRQPFTSADNISRQSSYLG